MEEERKRIGDELNYRRIKIKGNEVDTRNSHYTTIHLRLNPKHTRMLDELCDKWGYQRTFVIRELIRQEAERREQ